MFFFPHQLRLLWLKFLHFFSLSELMNIYIYIYGWITLKKCMYIFIFPRLINIYGWQLLKNAYIDKLSIYCHNECMYRFKHLWSVFSCNILVSCLNWRRIFVEINSLMPCTKVNYTQMRDYVTSSTYFLFKVRKH